MITRLRSALWVAALATAAAGCANNSDRPAPTSTGFETAPPGWSLGYPESVKPEPTGAGSLSGLLGGKDKDNEERIARLERQLVAAQVQQEQQAQAAPAVAAPAPVRPRVKLAVAGLDELSPGLANQLRDALEGLAPAYGASLTPTSDLLTQIRSYDCPVQSIHSCLARLAVYPGVQAVAVIAPASSDQDRISLQLTLHDAAHQVSYPAQTVSLPAAAGKAPRDSVQALASDLLQRSVRTARLGDWSTRAFGGEGKRIYVAAGQRSGLEVGDVLEIREPGRLIKAPTGTPAGWIPGETKGKLRVTGYLGEDNAVAELIEGAAPTPQDHLVMPIQRIR